MNALDVLVKIVVLVGCVIALPFVLALYVGVPALWSVAASFALLVILASVWTRRRT